MKFYLKSWFIIILILLLAGLLFSILFLFDVVNQVDLFRLSGKENLAEEVESISDDSDIIIAYSEDAPWRGNQNAKVKVVEFADFQCPFCRESYSILNQVIDEHPNDIYLEYRHFALNQFSRDIAEASLCADEQGRFWEYHDLLFANQSILDDTMLTNFASRLALDQDQFIECITNRRYASQVSKDFNDALGFGVLATPTFFINGHKVQGVIPKEIWEKVLGEVR